MRYCPSCRQEFEAFAAQCPDCAVALVETLDVSSPPPGLGLELHLILAEDAEVAGWVRESAAATGVPLGALDEGDPVEGAPAGSVGLLVPGHFSTVVARALAADPRLEPSTFDLTGPDGEIEVVHLYRRAAATEAAPAELSLGLLREPVEQIRARADSVIVDLLRIVEHGDESARAIAAQRVAALGPVGLGALARHAARFAAATDAAGVHAIVRGLRERLQDAGALSDLHDVAADGQLPVEARVLALHALGRLGLRAAYARILPLLDDADETVREEADEALCTLADEDMGFDPDLDAEARRAVIERWRAWFEGR